MLILKNLSKSYSGKPILHNINLSFKKGEIISLLGPSGSGKTTLLNLILGLTIPDQGQIVHQDRDLTRLSMKDRGFNIVFQDYALFPNLNAKENIAYSLRNKKFANGQAEMDHLIDLLELGPHLSKRISELSGGQKQRVALARTLTAKPKLLLMDEPFSALDGVIKESVKAQVKLISRELKLTTLIVTHDPEEALTLSDRVLILNEGKIAQFGTPEEIIHNPADPFVENFIIQQLKIKYCNLSTLFKNPQNACEGNHARRLEVILG